MWGLLLVQYELLSRLNCFILLTTSTEKSFFAAQRKTNAKYEHELCQHTALYVVPVHCTVRANIDEEKDIIDSTSTCKQRLF